MKKTNGVVKRTRSEGPYSDKGTEKKESEVLGEVQEVIEDQVTARSLWIRLFIRIWYLGTTQMFCIARIGPRRRG